MSEKNEKDLSLLITEARQLGEEQIRDDLGQGKFPAEFETIGSLPTELRGLWQLVVELQNKKVSALKAYNKAREDLNATGAILISSMEQNGIQFPECYLQFLIGENWKVAIRRMADEDKLSPEEEAALNSFDNMLYNMNSRLDKMSEKLKEVDKVLDKIISQQDN